MYRQRNNEEQRKEDINKWTFCFLIKQINYFINDDEEKEEKRMWR